MFLHMSNSKVPILIIVRGGSFTEMCAPDSYRLWVSHFCGTRLISNGLRTPIWLLPRVSHQRPTFSRSRKGGQVPSFLNSTRELAIVSLLSRRPSLHCFLLLTIFFCGSLILLFSRHGRTWNLSGGRCQWILFFSRHLSWPPHPYCRALSHWSLREFIEGWLLQMVLPFPQIEAR